MSVTWHYEGEQERWLPHKHDEWCEPMCRGEYQYGVNMNNANHAAVMLALQLDPEDFAGEIDALDLKARIALALAIDLDLSSPMLATGGPGTGQARWIEMGRARDDIPYRLRRLEAVADQAAALGVRVGWA